MSIPTVASHVAYCVSQYGFSLPEREIRPVGEETGSMVKYLATFIARSKHSAFQFPFFVSFI